MIRIWNYDFKRWMGCHYHLEPIVYCHYHLEPIGFLEPIGSGTYWVNQSDRSKLTIEEYLYSGWIDFDSPSTEEKAFLKSMQIKQLSFENFYRFHQDITHRIIALKASSFGGEFSTEQTPQKKLILDKIYPLEEKIVSLRNAIKKETQFNAKVRLNMQVKAIESEIERLKAEL